MERVKIEVDIEGINLHGILEEYVNLMRKEKENNNKKKRMRRR
jgi:hypothetical protein